MLIPVDVTVDAVVGKLKLRRGNFQTIAQNTAQYFTWILFQLFL